MPFNRQIAFFRFYGLSGTWQLIKIKLPYLSRLKGYQAYLNILNGKKGLEIGGPTAYFRKTGPLPIYPVIGALDGLNFSLNTIWEGSLSEGNKFKFDDKKRPGWQFIGEADDLKAIPDGKYDFVISSHCLEHLANPIKALLEWIRVINKGGYLLLVLPLKEKMFDHKRPLTLLSHMIDDHKHGIGEDDLTHLEEILELHDFKLDLRSGAGDVFIERCRNNYKNRCLHQHVFNEQNLIELLNYVGLKIVKIDYLLPRDIVVIAKKGSING
ncbi:MAG: methyltransferase domain-containing protein [Candidatus Margulisiibacteriota bacterium]